MLLSAGRQVPVQGVIGLGGAGGLLGTALRPLRLALLVISTTVPRPTELRSTCRQTLGKVKVSWEWTVGYCLPSL